MTDWFARPVLHVTDVETSLRFYVDRLGFTSPWRYEEDGKARVAQAERQGCAPILAAQWPEKGGQGLMFIAVNVAPETREAEIAALDALRKELEAKGVPASSTASGVFFATRPDLGNAKSSFPILRRAACDTALSTGALRLVDYDLAAG